MAQVAPAGGEYLLLFSLEERRIKEQRAMHFLAVEVVVQRGSLFR
jgi:hypothetical protein